MGIARSGLLVASLGFCLAMLPAPGETLPTMVSVPVVQPIPAQIDVNDGFSNYLLTLRARALEQGISQASIDALTAGLTYNSKVVELDRAQPGASTSSAPSFWRYYRAHVDAARINGGREMLVQTGSFGPAIAQQYGVPVNVLLAIWGHETHYGRVKGNFDLPRSLASLAYDGRRRHLFESEFFALLKMADRGVPRSRMVGSWAGAFGNPQFLPSVYLRLARDGDGDGFADIWNSQADTLASIANYFRNAGWRTGDPWGVRVKVPAELDRSALVQKIPSPTCPKVHARHSVWKSVAEWRSLGLEPQAAIDDNTMAALFEPDGPENGSFLLTGNYRVILQYNCSNYYALSVGLLADEIAR